MAKFVRTPILKKTANGCSLQSSAYYYIEGLVTFYGNGIQIKRTSNQCWHVTRYQHVTQWHTSNTWKVSTSLKWKVYETHLYGNVSQAWTLFLNWRIKKFLSGPRRGKGGGVKPYRSNSAKQSPNVLPTSP